MTSFEVANERRRRMAAVEGVELNAEAKEKQIEEAEKKMAAKERAEVVGKEVKNTKQQIQNIMANMQQVVKAVAAIRAQLQLSDDNSIPSVEQDQKSLDALHRKLDGLMGEMRDLRQALLAEEINAVREEHPDWNSAAMSEEAGLQVRAIFEKLEIEI